LEISMLYDFILQGNRCPQHFQHLLRVTETVARINDDPKFDSSVSYALYPIFEPGRPIG
jgi:hypothetical protein